MLRGLLVTGEITNVRFSTGHSTPPARVNREAFGIASSCHFLLECGERCVSVCVEEEQSRSKLRLYDLYWGIL
jgi:hypothetical protein